MGKKHLWRISVFLMDPLLSLCGSCLEVSTIFCFYLINSNFYDYGWSESPSSQVNATSVFRVRVSLIKLSSTHFIFILFKFDSIFFSIFKKNFNFVELSIPSLTVQCTHLLFFWFYFSFITEPACLDTCLLLLQA